MGNLQLIHKKCGELWEETKPSHPIFVINGQKVYSVLPIAKWALKSPSSMRDFSSAWKTLNRIILQYVTTTVVSFIFHYFFFSSFQTALHCCHAIHKHSSSSGLWTWNGETLWLRRIYGRDETWLAGPLTALSLSTRQSRRDHQLIFFKIIFLIMFIMSMIWSVAFCICRISTNFTK